MKSYSIYLSVNYLNDKYQLVLRNDDESKKILTDFMNSEVFRNQQKLLEEKKKTIKHGNNIVHINYYQGILIEEDLKDILTSLQKTDLDLSSYDKMGVVYNSLEDYTNLMDVAINSELTKNIVLGVAGSFVWDTIKFITKKIFIKVKDANSTHTTKSEMTFGLSLSLNRNTQFEFRLDGKFSKETIDTALDKTIEFVKTQKTNDEFHHPTFLYFDHEKNVWIPVDMMEDIRKRIAKEKKKPSKKGGEEKITIFTLLYLHE